MGPPGVGLILSRYTREGTTDGMQPGSLLLPHLAFSTATPCCTDRGSSIRQYHLEHKLVMIIYTILMHLNHAYQMRCIGCQRCIFSNHKSTWSRDETHFQLSMATYIDSISTKSWSPQDGALLHVEDATLRQMPERRSSW